MSLIPCPECGHEVSTHAAACPNCARPTHAPPVVERKVIVTQPVDPDKGFPSWALIPIGLLAVVLVFVVYLAFRDNEDTANTNLKVNVERKPTETRSTTTSTVPSASTSTVPTSETITMPPPSQTTTVPGSSNVPPVAPPPDKGSVTLNAKATLPTGSIQAVRGTKFYLLEEDVETILRAARVDPIEGNTLAGSLGLAAVFPDRYGDFQRAAVRAIALKAKYSGTTNGSGGAKLSEVDPREYYLFGIAKIGRGFALWNSQVSVIAGDNLLNLSPQSVTEIADPNS